MRHVVIILTIICATWSLGNWAASQNETHANSTWSITTPAPGSLNLVPQMPGFPIEFTADAPENLPFSVNGLVFADLDADGRLEIVFSSSTDFFPWSELGMVHVWDMAGNAIPNFPVSTLGGAGATPSIADLDHDGDLEIVQVTMDQEDRVSRLYAIHHDGSVMPGFPVTLDDWGASQSTSLYDLDSDGGMEIVLATDAWVRIFENDGTEWNDGWPVALDSESYAVPAIGDVYRDGAPEIFVPEEGRLRLLEIDGSDAAGWPVVIPEAEFPWLSSAALADLDGDGDLEIVVPTWFGSPPANNPNWRTEVFVFNHDGTIIPGWPQGGRIYRSWCPPAISDLDGDGELEIVIGSQYARPEGGPTGQSAIWAWSPSGERKAGFPWISEVAGGDVRLVTTADVDGDGSIEIFAFGSGADPVEGEDVELGYVFGIDANGQALPDFPLRPRGSSLVDGAILDDIDRDGDVEIGVVSTVFDDANAAVNINVYDLGGDFDRRRLAWPTFHGANQRGGLYKRRYRGWRIVHTDGLHSLTSVSE